MDFASWTTGIGTLLAVIVALFKEEIVKLWRRPELTGRIALRAPDCEKTQIEVIAAQSPQLQFEGTNEGGTLSVTGAIVPPTNTPLWRGDAYFFRIWIENKGRQRAEKVQVFAAQLKMRHADGIFRQVDTFLPMNLRWTHSQTNPQIFADINPAMGRHCDLGCISDPANITQPPLPGLRLGDVSFDLALEVFPNTQSHRLLPGCYHLQLKIAAANADPVVQTIEVNLAGRWYTALPDMFATGIGIKEID